MAAGTSLLGAGPPYLQSRRSACRIRVWVSERVAQGTPGRCPGRRDGGASAQRACAWPFQALEKKGIGHLEEKELKERNKRIQEDNRLELQKVGLPLAGLHGAGLPSRGPEAGPPWLK